MEGVAAEAASHRRAPAPVEPVLDLRQQHHHHRGPHRARLLRGGRGALPRLWLAGAARRRRQRRPRGLVRAGDLPPVQRPADADHRQLDHRLRRARRSRTPPRPTRTRSARTRSRAPSAPMAGRRTPQFLVPDGVYEQLSRRHRPARRRALRRPGSGFFDEAKASDPAHGRRARRASCEGRLPEGWDQRHPGLPGRRQGHRHARILRQGAQRHRASTCRGCSAARPISRPPTRPSSNSRAPARSTPFEPGGRNIHFGVREHAMGSIVNGLGLWACAPTARPSWSSPTTCARRSASRR